MSEFAYGLTTMLIPARLQEAVQLRRVVRLVRAHRGAVRGGDAAAEPELHGVVGHHLEEARARVVRLVAVHVDAARVLLRELEHAVHFLQPELRRRLVVRDAADAVDAEPERVLEPLLVAVAREDAVLRERGDLHRAEIGQLVAHAQQPAHHRLVLAGDVGVRADEERSLRDRPADDLARALEDVLLGEARLQLAPDVDALDQRARLVPARLAGCERRVEMEVAVDERSRDEPRFGVELLCGVDGERLADPRPAAVLGREIDEPAVEQARVAHDEIHARESTGRGSGRRALPRRPYGSRAATRSDAAVPRGRRRPETLTRTGTTPGRRTCDRLTLVLPGMFTRRSACDGSADAAGDDDDAVAQAASRGARRRGAASAGPRRRGSGRPTSPPRRARRGPASAGARG